ncbi:hypothetical protein Taro_002077 [Colocasia esculenta]|uniref:CCHC-type domain-containing protein n=1 Tax=Colocasia esculenta TaxID=4460 RepID=A0A843TI47_COLES|nr:hypothetical protein [Colocasia esculenta]
MVKRAQLLEDAIDFTDRIKGKFVKKEVTSSQSSAKPTNGKKRPFNITEGSSQERKPKVLIPNTPTKSHCKHCDKLGHMADECWRKAGACLHCGSHEHRIPKSGRKPCERDGPIGHVHKDRRDNTLCRDLIETGPIVAICCPIRLSLSRPVQAPVAISVDPVAALTRVPSYVSSPNLLFLC